MSLFAGRGCVLRANCFYLSLLIFAIFSLHNCAGQIFSYEENNGQLLRQTLAVCSYDRDCMENAFCRNQETCECMEGYLVDRNRTHVQCLKIATSIGDPCTEDVQCHVTFTTQAECRNNACGCSPGSHFEDKRCYKSVGIGHVCLTSHNCYVEGSASFCVDGYCSCPLQHHANADRSRCLKSIELGDACSIDEECTAMHSRCFGVCGCKVDHVLSKDGKRCFKAASAIGDPCEEDGQCREFLKNARCGAEGKCKCNMDFKIRGTVCRRDFYIRMLGQPCKTVFDCIQGPPEEDFGVPGDIRIDCLSGLCSCPKDYEPTEDRQDCIGYSEINGSIRWHASSLLASVIFAIARFIL